MQFISIKQNFIWPGIVSIVIFLWLKRMRGLALVLATALAVSKRTYAPSLLIHAKLSDKGQPVQLKTHPWLTPVRPLVSRST